MRLLKRTSPPTDRPASGYSLVDREMLVRGDLVSDGSVRIEGRLEGTVLRADTVVIGVGATMVGDAHAREVIVGGTLTGNIAASERVELQSTAVVNGDVTTHSLLVQEGGVVNGQLFMRASESLESPVPLLQS